MSRQESGANIGFARHMIRKTAALIMSHQKGLGFTETDQYSSLSQVKETLRQKKGVVVIYNHFSDMDPAILMSMLTKHAITGSKKYLSPIGQHVDSKKLHMILNLAGVELKTIATESSLRSDNSLTLNHGAAQFATDSVNLIREGGMVYIAHQGTRLPRLGQPEKPTIGTFMLNAQKKGNVDYSLFFVGLGVKGVDDYSVPWIKKYDRNKGLMFTVNLGSCLSVKDFLARATLMAEEAWKKELEEARAKAIIMGKKPEDIRVKKQSPFKFADRVVHKELSKVVPSSYR